MDVLYALFAICFCVAVFEFIVLLSFKRRIDIKEQKYQMEAISHALTKETLKKTKAECDAAKLDLLRCIQQNSELMKLKTMRDPIKTASRGDIMDAVRYAVIKSHPDNGGNTDDFVKFNQCYKELKKKEREPQNNDDFIFYKKKAR